LIAQGENDARILAMRKKAIFFSDQIFWDCRMWPGQTVTSLTGTMGLLR
jgi:hypothetical protein